MEATQDPQVVGQPRERPLVHDARRHRLVLDAAIGEHRRREARGKRGLGEVTRAHGHTGLAQASKVVEARPQQQVAHAPERLELGGRHAEETAEQLARAPRKRRHREREGRLDPSQHLLGRRHDDAKHGTSSWQVVGGVRLLR